MNAIQRFFFNIFLFCFGLGLLFFVKLDSYASELEHTSTYTLISYNGVENASPTWSRLVDAFDFPESARVAFLVNYTGEYAGVPIGNIQLFSNVSVSVPLRRVIYSANTSGSTNVDYILSSSYNSNSGIYGYSAYGFNFGNNSYQTSVPIFSDRDDMIDYLINGVFPEIPYDDSLELDSFKVTSWSIGNLQALFKSKFDVTWSDSRISLVQVRITGTANDVTYESSSSPFKGKFQADQFVFQKGDVIHLVATPYKADGSYGVSLYYSVTYNDNIPFSNTYRKMVNNNTNDNTLTIPYNGTSGNDTVTLPVDGVTTNVTYKVNYNPVTNEYGDSNIYEIYYSPVVVYPDNTSDQEVDDTQDEIINNYNTTNYYETTKYINFNFDIDFGDISANDIGEGFNGVSGFFNGFGSFIGRLSNWILVLFPFLPPIVASSIVFMFGLVIFIAGIALILKIIGAVGNIIDAILPL